MVLFTIGLLVGVLGCWVYKEYRAGTLRSDLAAVRAELAAVKAKL